MIVKARLILIFSLWLSFAYACSPQPSTEETFIGEMIATGNQDIAGIWDSIVLWERGFHQFNGDGTLVIAYTFEDLQTNPVFDEPAKYWFEGDVFHVEDFCGHGKYQLTVYKENGENQKLTFKLIEDPCEQRVSDWSTGMRWVKP